MLANRTVKLLCLGVFVFLITSGGIYSHQPSRITVTGFVHEQHGKWFKPGKRIPCDVNAQPGWSDNQRMYWRTDNPDCPGEEIRDAMRDTKREDLWDKFPEYRNKTILLAGDSVGRHLAEVLCGEFLQKGLANEKPPGFEAHYGWSSKCTNEHLGMTVLMGHIYGMSNTSDPEVMKILDKAWIGSDWDLQSRINRWFNTTLKGYEPDYIQLNSGAWEYRAWYVRDILNNKKHDDLPKEDRDEAARMAVQSLDFLQKKWPKAKVWYMHMSMMNEDDMKIRKGHGKDFLKKGADVDDPNSYPPLYTWRRQAQYRASMKRIIAEAGYESLDYVQIQSVMSKVDFSSPDDVIHPQWKPRRTMGSMIMSRIRRHALYGV